MTNSKIMEAKQGLQLLKKKMSRNGMSREKIQPERKEEELPPRKTQYVPAEEEVVREPKRPTPKPTEKPPQREDKRTPPPSSKSIEDRPIKKQNSLPQREEYVNEIEEVPLKSNQDFMAILEREMAKENSKNPPAAQSRPAAKKAPSYEEAEEVELVPCSKGCGRNFNPDVLPKHEKVCEKVFQSKRKAFNSAAFRQPEVEDFKQPPPPPPPPAKAEGKKKQPEKAEKAEKIPKWKQQSAAFRAGLKAGRGEQLTAEEKNMGQDDMIQCSYCGRKFNETAGKRHIAFCETKAKQLPKMNTTKKK